MIVVALGLVSTPPLAAAPWYEHYEKAEQALQKEAWREAIDELQQALERKGDSGYRVRTYGMKVVDYLPYLKLGIAYHHLGLHDAALEAFDTEERLNVFHEVPVAAADLERFRERTNAARRRKADAALLQTETVVASSLARARSLAEQGQIEDAMEALAPGLAADPQHASAKALMDELVATITARDQRRTEAETARRHRAAAQAHIDAGEWEPAIQLLRQVVAVAPSPEVRTLLAHARDQLAQRVAEQQRDQQTATIVRRAIDEAAQMRDADRLDEALARLEVVFAVDPENTEAGTLRDDVLRAQRAALEAARVSRMLAEAREFFDAGHYEKALSVANQVLALDQGNEKALTTIGPSVWSDQPQAPRRRRAGGKPASGDPLL